MDNLIRIIEQQISTTSDPKSISLLAGAIKNIGEGAQAIAKSQYHQAAADEQATKSLLNLSKRNKIEREVRQLILADKVSRVQLSDAITLMKRNKRRDKQEELGQQRLGEI